MKTLHNYMARNHSDSLCSKVCYSSKGIVKLLPSITFNHHFLLCISTVRECHYPHPCASLLWGLHWIYRLFVSTRTDSPLCSSNNLDESSLLARQMRFNQISVFTGIRWLAINTIA